jgi:hypothetical protein
MAELELLGLGREQRQQRIAVVPEDVRVVRPSVLEAVFFGELHELEEPGVGWVRQDRDAEAQHRASSLGARF